MIAQLPLIPFVHEVEKILYLFYFFCRFTGLFLICPLFSNQLLSSTTRLLLTVFCTLLIGMAMMPLYFGAEATLSLPEFDPKAPLSPLKIVLRAIQEISVGYIIGFIFLIATEALMIAGQQVGLMIGFSMAELFDPISGTSQGLISQLFTITGTLLLLSFEFHLEFIHLCAKSFEWIPLGGIQFPFELLKEFTLGTSKMFEYAIRFAALPYLLLFLVTFGLGLMSKIMPEMNIFMIGFPVKILFGLLILFAALGAFPELVRALYTELFYLNERILSLMSPN